MDKQLPHVVIVGAGFGGLRAARAMEGAPAQVTLIDRNNFHLFQPFLYQVATAGLSPDEIAQPVRAILRRQQNLAFCLSKVERVDLEHRCLETDRGDVRYDYLILAPGGQTNYFGNQALTEHGFGLKEVDDAVDIRNHILAMFEQGVQESDPEKRRAMLTFVIAGGGPTGVESSGALSELIRLVLIKDYPQLDIKDVRVILLEGSDRLLPGMPADLSEATAETLWRKHVEVRFGAMVSGYDGETVTLKSGEMIPARTLIWAAGVRAVKVLDTLGVPQDRLGRVMVEETLQVPGHPEVYVIGDAAAFPTPDQKPLPMVAPVAMQQASVAAENVRRALAGQPQRKFVYKDPGSLATIGRSAAVAVLGRWKFKGFVAWVLWLVVHILQLIGFRNRLVVLINWIWDYIFYDRAIRLIIAD